MVQSLPRLARNSDAFRALYSAGAQLNTPDDQDMILHRLARLGIGGALAASLALTLDPDLVHAASDQDIALIVGGTYPGQPAQVVPYVPRPPDSLDGKAVGWDKDTGELVEAPTVVQNGTVVDATSSTKGILQLTGPMGGTAGSPTVFGLASTAALTEQIQDVVGAMFKPGTNVTMTYDDTAGTLTVFASGGGTATTDPEVVRDVIGGALLPGNNMQITVNDAGDTIRFDVTGLSAVALSGLYSDLVGTPAAYTDAQALAAATPYVDAKISKALGTFTLTTPPALGYVTGPGYVALEAVTVDTVELRGFRPVLGSNTIYRLRRYSGGVQTVLTTDVVMAVGARRAVVPPGLAAALAIGDEFRVECVSAGILDPGGQSLQVTLASAGIVFPAVAAAPAAPASLTAVGSASSVALSWPAVTGASEYFVYRNNVLLSVVPSGTLTYTDSTGVSGTTYTYGVGAANTSAMSTLATASAASVNGAFYTGAGILTDAASGTPHWTLTTGTASGASLTNSGTDAVFAVTGFTTGQLGSKALRTATDQAVAAAMGKAIHTYKIRWGQSAGGLRFGTRRTAADDYGVLWDLGYSAANSLKIQVKKTGDSSHAIAKQAQFTGTTTTADVWVEIYDDPTAQVYEIRIWTDGGARPSAATLAVVSGDTSYAAMSDTLIVTGRAKVEQLNTLVGTAQTMTVRQAQYALIP